MLKILQKLQNTLPTTQISVVVAVTLLWFLPDMCGRQPVEGLVPFVLLNRFTWFEIPTFWAHVLQYFCLTSVAYTVLYTGRSSAVIPKRSSIQLIVLLLAFSASWRTQYFAATTVAFIFFLMANNQMISMYGQKRECVKQAFNSAFFIVIASLFDRTFIYFLLIMLVGMIIFGALTPRTICSFLAGLFVPIALLVGTFAYFDMLPNLSGLLELQPIFNYTSDTFVYFSGVGFVCILLICYVFSLFAFAASSATQNLDVRLNYRFVNCSFVITFVTSVLLLRVGMFIICPIFFGTLVISFYFVTNSSSRVANILFWFLLVSAVGSRIAMIFGV